MGESITEAPIVEDKMRPPPHNSGSPLEVSVSFGRFESDSLSWEKWSSFSPNKYLEEVEKCATPGSVAQKKAYFEAHYKKIAARKIQELEEEKQNEAKISNEEDENSGNHVEKPYGYDDQAEHLDSFQNTGNVGKSNENVPKSEDLVEKPCERQGEHVDSFQVSSNFDGSDGSIQNGDDHVEKPFDYQAKHLDSFQTSRNFDESNDNVQNGEDHDENPYEYEAKHVNGLLFRRQFDESHECVENGGDCTEKPSEYQAKKAESSIIKHFDESDESVQNGEDHIKKPCYEYQAKKVDSLQIGSHFDESNESSTITMDSQCSTMDETVDSRSSLVYETKKEIFCEPNIPDLSKTEDFVLVQEGKQVNVFQEEIEMPTAAVEDKLKSQKKLEKKIGKVPEKGKEKTDLGAPKKSPKVNHLNKHKPLTETKKKPLPLLPKKVPEISTPKTSKPILGSSKATPSRSSIKKPNSSSLQKSKNVGEIKKRTSSSLHMSLNLGPANEDSPSLPTNRKSLIMEKMGDKDIVKRAFKSFKKNINQGGASEDPSSSVHNEVSTSRPARNVSTIMTLQKENSGIRRSGKVDVQRSQLGRSLNSTINGSPGGVNTDQRRAKPAPSFGVKSDEKRKNMTKNPVEQVSAREQERERLVSKSKEKEAEIKKFRQHFNFKATPMPSFYRGHAASKISSVKEGEHQGTPEMHR